MKTLRYRIGNDVKPGILDAEENIRDASSLVSDWDGDNVTVEKLSEIKNTDISEVLVICENNFILSFLNDNLSISKNYAIYENLFLNFKIYLKSLLIFIINFFKVFIKYAVIKTILRIFFHKNQNKFDEKIYLIHTSNLKITNKNKIQLGYFPNLNNYISKKIYYMIISKLSFIEKILKIREYKENNIIIIEEYVSIYEFFINIKNFIKGLQS